MPPEFYMRLFRNLVLRPNGHRTMSSRRWTRQTNMGFRKSGKQPRIILARKFPWMIDQHFKTMQGGYMTPYGATKPLPAKPVKGTFKGLGHPSQRMDTMFGYVGTAPFKDRKGPRSARQLRLKTTGS